MPDLIGHLVARAGLPVGAGNDEKGAGLPVGAGNDGKGAGGYLSTE